MTQNEIEQMLNDLNNRVRYLEMSNYPVYGSNPFVTDWSTPPTQACPPIDFEAAAKYNEQQVKECLTPFTKE